MQRGVGGEQRAGGLPVGHERRHLDGDGRQREHNHLHPTGDSAGHHPADDHRSAARDDHAVGLTPRGVGYRADHHLSIGCPEGLRGLARLSSGRCAAACVWNRYFGRFSPPASCQARRAFGPKSASWWMRPAAGFSKGGWRLTNLLADGRRRSGGRRWPARSHPRRNLRAAPSYRWPGPLRQSRRRPPGVPSKAPGSARGFGCSVPGLGFNPGARLGSSRAP